ncbi:MAG: DMT family transporter [Acidocella sp.]|nr:DMT family transporter [Acidocella sp.]
MDGGQNSAGRGGFERRSLKPGLNLGSKPGLTPGFAIAATVLAVILWGFSPIGTRYMVGTGFAGMPAMAFTGLRYTLAALIFSPLLWQARHWNRRDWALGLICGLVGVAGYNIPAALGQRSVSAGLTGLLDGVEPLFIVLFSAIAQRRFPAPLTIIATFIGLAGVVLLAQGSGPALGDPEGDALVLLAAVLWAIYCVIVPALINRRGALPTTAVTIMFGAIPMLLSGLPQMQGMLITMTGWDWLVTITLTLGTSVIAMLAWNAGSAVLGAEKAGWYLYLLPVVSLIGGALLLGEPVRLWELAGGALVLLAVYLSQR